MKLGKMLDIFRQDADDTTEPYLWSNEELIDFANDAEREACRRARLLVDSTTTAICQITALAGASTVTLDPRVIFVRRVRVTGQTKPLGRASWRDMDACLPGWEDHTGTIQAFISDWQTGKLRLYRIPTAVSSILNLTVVRLPLVDMNDLEETPEINARYHDSLLHWIRYRAYMKKDADTYDEKQALNALDLFEQEFGKKSAAVDEEWIEREQQADAFDGTF